MFSVFFWITFGAGVYAEEGVLKSSPLVIDQSSPGSQKLFEELEPLETGLADFKNDFSSPHGVGEALANLFVRGDRDRHCPRGC